MRGNSQSGQAIVLIALMLTVLVGMTALAIDGSRAYALKRDLQAAVDSAALAAADKLQQSGSYATAEQAATNVFASNLRLYSSPSCSPSYGSPGAAPWTVTCSYPDGTALTQVVRAVGPQGSQFTISATRSLQLQFGRVLSSGSSPVLGGSATGNVNNLVYTPTIAALNQAGCGGAGGTAISLSGSGTLNVNGDVVSNGSITVSSGALRVTGDAYARCQSSVAGVSAACYPSGASSPCSYPDVLGATRSGFRLSDPNYPSPTVVGSSQSRPGRDVVLSSGTYAPNPNLNRNVCYFLSGGVYAWQAGYTNSNALVSNELKPPDEPNVANNQVLSAHQFWNSNGVNCAGAFILAAQGVGLNAIQRGTWAIELTSVRTDAYNGRSYTRESAPSMCRTVSVSTGQAIQIQTSNVPGASSYNVYAAPPPSGCAGPFGLAGSIAVVGPVRNDDMSGCAYGSGPGNGHGNGNGNNGNNCSLGGQDSIFDATLLGPLFTPNPLAQPGVIGAYPPDPETAPLSGNLPNQNPPRRAGSAGDRANENNCESTSGVYISCGGPITPGAVEFYVPAGGCLSTSNSADTYVFTGYQYNWVAVFEPGAGAPPANTCANTLGAATNTAFIGLIYMPSATADVTSRYAFESAMTGGLIAGKVTFSGTMPNVTYNSGYAPVPPASRLTS
jgi:Flp pilus assembly protein TadG